MMEWKYIEEIPLIPIEIINPYNSYKSKQLALVDSGSDWCSLPKQLWDDLGFLDIGLLELGTPLGWAEVGFSWCNMNIIDKMIPVEIHYFIHSCQLMELGTGENSTMILYLSPLLFLSRTHHLGTFTGCVFHLLFDWRKRKLKNTASPK